MLTLTPREQAALAHAGAVQSGDGWRLPGGTPVGPVGALDWLRAWLHERGWREAGPSAPAGWWVDAGAGGLAWPIDDAVAMALEDEREVANG